MISMHVRSVAVVFALGLGLISSLGCGASDPRRYSVSGNVKFGGKPVPAGAIRSAPDAAKDNTGPGTQASIKEGYYETPRGQGTVGGDVCRNDHWFRW